MANEPRILVVPPIAADPQEPSMPDRVTKRECVLQAIAECDRLGRERFLGKYGFGAHRSYALIHEGRHYDSKAIYGVAAMFEHGKPLQASEFSGGKAAAAKWLAELGFEVVQSRGCETTSL